MLDYIYMTNLPFYIYFLYFVLGVTLSLISFKIANERFAVKKMPFWVAVIMSIFCCLFLIPALALVKFHIGLYLLFNAIAPYVSIWRSNNLKN